EILAAARGGAPVAVATVISGRAGVDPAPGTKLLVRNDGARAGGWGGALEDAVAEDCLASLTRVPRESIQAIYYRAEGRQVHRLEAKEGDAFHGMIQVNQAPPTP